MELLSNRTIAWGKGYFRIDLEIEGFPDPEEPSLKSDRFKG